MHRDLKPENILFRKPGDMGTVVVAGNIIKLAYVVNERL